MAKNGTYSPDIIATLRAALDAAAPPLLTKQEVVRELRNAIRAARGRGCSDQQILDIFAAQGITMTPSTLRSYLADKPAKVKPPRKASALAAAQELESVVPSGDAIRTAVPADTVSLETVE
ncbi:hypothetical protein TSH100_15365 [Azospirillum sp. TSH100]|uniref:hypothetical protein n=1 Tax=Azospirillum sp. TSH100 TaxID=652764 RepID=UPI000D61F01D|nr:hypothetical protein [Azospirillum sp. TSH100]PWC85525.1 hypothetical protein TSH100_15365 [Azospirillum sp. TSH100]